MLAFKVLVFGGGGVRGGKGNYLSVTLNVDLNSSSSCATGALLSVQLKCSVINFLLPMSSLAIRRL